MITLPANGHRAAFTGELFSGVTGFARGSLSVVASAAVAAVALRLNSAPRLVLTTLPVVGGAFRPPTTTFSFAGSAAGPCPGGGGGMLTFELRGGLAAARRLLERVRVFSCAESLGGVESLIEHPALMTHASLPAERRAALGIGDGLVRISAGIEDAEDLVADLRQALEGP
jgi:hypothetical protein